MLCVSGEGRGSCSLCHLGFYYSLLNVFECFLLLFCFVLDSLWANVGICVLCRMGMYMFRVGCYIFFLLFNLNSSAIK